MATRQRVFLRQAECPKSLASWIAQGTGSALARRAMPDVIPCLHPAQVRRSASFEQHKFSLVATVLPPGGGKSEVSRIETTGARDPPVHRQARRSGWSVGLRA